MGSSSMHKQNRGGTWSTWLRGLFFPGALDQTSAQKHKRGGRKERRLRFEACEDRRLLAVTTGWDPATGVLSFAGDAADDRVVVIGQSTYVDIYVGGRYQARLTGANSGNVNTITFDGAGGNDALAIQNIQPGASLTVDLADAENLAVAKTRDLAVTRNAALSLGPSILSGNLTVGNGGDLTQSGAVTVGGDAVLHLAGNNVTLTNASNNFKRVMVTAADASLRDVNSLELGNCDITGNLSVEANLNSTTRGALTQAAGTTLLVDGATTLAVGRASTMRLDNPGNQLAGPVSITSGGDATIRNAVATTLGPSNLTGNLTVTVTASAATHAIAQSGRLVVGKTATFIGLATKDIVLDTFDANNFAAVALNGVRDARLADVNALVLGGSTVSRDLTVATRGAITQTGPLAVGGDTVLSAGGNNNIVLNKANTFGGTVRVPAARNVTLVDSNALDLGASTVLGSLTVAANGNITDSGSLEVAGRATLAAGLTNDITLDNGAKFTEVAVTGADNVKLVDTAGGLALGTSRISGTLDVATPGPLTQSGPLTVFGSATLHATGAGGAAADVALGNTRNDFRDAVIVTAARDVSLADLNGLQLGASTISGDLKVDARGGLTQSGALDVAGTTTLSVARTTNIDLSAAPNRLAGAVSIASAANAWLDNTAAAETILGACGVAGNLTLTSTGPISQTGPLVVGRTADLATAGGLADILLADPGNNFYIAAIAGSDVVLTDLNSIILGASSAATLDVMAGRGITQTGPLTVLGAASLTAGIVDSIVLNGANDFQAALSVTAGANVVLNDVDALDFGESAVGGALSVTAGGPISQSGPLLVAGKTTLSTADGIILDDANDFREVAVTSAGAAVVLNDINALVLGRMDLMDGLTVTTDGPITQSGPVVTGLGSTTTLNAGTSDITLANPDNDFATVEVTGNKVSLADRNAMDCGLWTIGANLDVKTAGAITQSFAVSVTGDTTLAAGAGNNITLNLANDFTGDVSVTSANNVVLTAGTDLTLGASTITGDLTATAAGLLSQTGPLKVDGTLTATSTADDITFDDPDNAFLSVIASGVNVTLVNNGDIDLAAITATGNLVVQAVGQISNSGAVVAVNATFIATNAAGGYSDIVLGAGTQVSGVLSLWGHDVSVANETSTVLGDSMATGNLTVVAAGPTATLTNYLGGGMHGLLSVNQVTTLTASKDLDLYVNGCVFGDWPTDPADLVLSGDPVTIHP